MTQGKIITFYSYKGGTGRSMALANTAWILALNGKKVLTIDWDLEAPGLHRYFLPFLEDPELSKTPGLIQLFWSYINLVLTPRESWPPGVETPLVFADVFRYVVPINYPFSTGSIHFLGAGQQDTGYASQVRDLDWNNFYSRLGGMEFVDHLQLKLRTQYDFILVDSRTGISDTAGICTIQMPDSIVLCYTLNRQSITGIESVAKSIKEQRGTSIKFFPVAMRVERAIQGYEKASQMARFVIEPLLDYQFTKEDFFNYWKMSEVAYYPDYAFEETLAIFKDLPDQRSTLLSDMVWLAETISEEASGSFKIPEMDSKIREKYLKQFEYSLSLLDSSRTISEVKLIVLGNGNAGKTSIVKRLVYNTFEIESQKTQGIQVTDWLLNLPSNEEILLHIWDFGGQEIMHSTHQLFLTHKSLYLLVLNGRDGNIDSTVEYWLRTIESFGGESPVVIVLNKINNRFSDINQRGLTRKYPFIQGFVNTDCMSGNGIEEFHQLIQKVVFQWDSLRVTLPLRWSRIKNRISALSSNYLSSKEFKTICHQEGEADEQMQEQLANILHLLGIALSFKEDPRLHDIHILNPYWLTNAIYRILNAEIVANQKGVLTLSDTEVILSSREYPSHICLFIMNIMKKFELCFGFPEDDRRYLIPEFLDKEEPVEVGTFEEDCLQFQYHYPVLPEGLLPRFIVRTNVLSEGLPRWRTGAILKFEDNRALVKADTQDKKVFIKVNGPMTGRRRLLAIIRSDFERIHYDIRQLNPLEMVPIAEIPKVVIPYRKLLVMEEKGIKSFMEVIGDNVIEVEVLSLLNGVDLAETRRRDILMERHSETVRLFYSYSHRDETLRNELETHLKLLQRQGLISTWHDRQIEAGEEWKQKIDDNLERADVILLLVSADFIASDYCWEKEVTRALGRHHKGEAVVVPVILRDTNWSNTPFARLKALPKDAMPVTKWTNKDSAWRNVAEGIEKAVKAVRQKRGFV